MALTLESGDGAGGENRENQDGNEDEERVLFSVFLDGLDQGVWW